MHKGFAVTFALLATLAFGAACTVHNTETPSLTGPSELGLSLTVKATPDTISQDGASQSSIEVTARDPNGSPKQGVTLRLDMAVNFTVQDYGTLSARTIVTGSDGKANTVYTAPPPPPASAGGSGTHVSIVVTPILDNAQVSNPESGPASIPTTVDIRLVPVTPILPPASTPTPAFTITPTPVNANVAATFDASTSCGGSVVGGTCDNSSPITSFAWSFGDGGSGTGATVSHTFTSAATFSVTLTVTNSRGLSASTTQQVSVTTSSAPSGDWVFSPSSPRVGNTIVFNADGVRAAAGRTIVQYSWIWGDNTPGGSGFLTTHVFSVAGTFNVTLTVRDDADQKATFTHAVSILP